ILYWAASGIPSRSIRLCSSRPTTKTFLGPVMCRTLSPRASRTLPAPRPAGEMRRSQPDHRTRARAALGMAQPCGLADQMVSFGAAGGQSGGLGVGGGGGGRLVVHLVQIGADGVPAVGAGKGGS